MGRGKQARLGMAAIKWIIIPTVCLLSGFQSDNALQAATQIKISILSNIEVHLVGFGFL